MATAHRDKDGARVEADLNTTVLTIERRTGVELSALLAEWPAEHDAALTRMRQMLDAGRQPAEHRVPAHSEMDGIRAGAVEGRPDELGRDRFLPRDPGRGDEIAAFDGTGEDA